MNTATFLSGTLWGARADEIKARAAAGGRNFATMTDRKPAKVGKKGKKKKRVAAKAGQWDLARARNLPSSRLEARGSG